MSSAQHSMHYAHALLRAFQKELCRVGRAGGPLREASSVKCAPGANRPSSLQSVRDSDLLSGNSFQKVRFVRNGNSGFKNVLDMEFLFFDVLRCPGRMYKLHVLLSDCFSRQSLCF